MNQIIFKRSITLIGLVYLLFLLLVIVFRYIVLLKFGFAYTDSDQTIMWFGLKEYAEGVFHEPRFYGQSYNSMLEALIVVPLYKFGIPAHKCLPFVTSAMALFPYIIISLFTFFKKSKEMAVVIISIPLLLPVEYSLITTIPRGFVTGIFITSFGCIFLFYPKSKWSFLILSFAGVLGFSVNSNSTLLFLPCIMYLFLENLKNKQFYLYTSIGLILGFSIHFLSNYFYILHPFYDLHKMELFYSFEAIVKGIKKLDIFFNDVTPVFWDKGFLVLFMFLILGFLLLRKKDYVKAFTVIVIPIIIIFTLGISKVHDGTNRIFYSYSRMYLTVPVLLGVSLSFFNVKNSKLLFAYLILPVVFLICQIYSLDSAIKLALSPSNDDKVAIATIDVFNDKCNHLNNICKTYKVELVIIINDPSCDFYNYGCAVSLSDFPKTLRPPYERRTWRLLEDEKKVYKNILIVDITRNPLTNADIVKEIPNESGLFLLENNMRCVGDLLIELPIPCRPYK